MAVIKWKRTAGRAGLVVVSVPKLDRMLCAGGTLVVKVTGGVCEKPDKKYIKLVIKIKLVICNSAVEGKG